MPEERTFEIHFLDLKKELVQNSLVLEGLGTNIDEKKEQVVKKLLEDHDCLANYRDDESALDNWLRFLCRINGLVFTRPVDSHLADAILDSGASKFLFWLA